jgi:hypothetical protein
MSAVMAFNQPASAQLANGHDHEGFLVATRDIQPGEELLWYYNSAQPYRHADNENFDGDEHDWVNYEEGSMRLNEAKALNAKAHQQSKC